jgi:ribosomal protein S21
MKTSSDLPRVTVKGDIDSAIRVLKNRLQASGIFSALKDRINNPSPSDRKRSKSARAKRRRIKQQQRQENIKK